MPTAADVRAKALDPPGRWDLTPDAVIDPLIAVCSTLHAEVEGEPEWGPLVAYHVAHLLALAGVGGSGGGGGKGAVASHSVSLGGASVTYAVQAVPAGQAVAAIDGRTVYGILALALDAAVPHPATA